MKHCPEHGLGVGRRRQSPGRAVTQPHPVTEVADSISGRRFSGLLLIGMALTLLHSVSTLFSGALGSLPSGSRITITLHLWDTGAWGGR